MLSSAAGLLTDQSFLSVFCAAMLTIGIGWGLRKKNILKAESRPVLNALLLKLTVPCLAFDAFMTDFARGELRRNVQILLISFALYLSMIALSQLIFIKYGRRKANLYGICFAIGQQTLYAMPILRAIYRENPSESMLSASMVAIAFRVMLYLYAFYSISGVAVTGGSLKQNLKKAFLTPVMLAMFAGFFIWLTQGLLPCPGGIPLLRLDLRFPALYAVVPQMATLVNPLAMLLIGSTLGESRLGDALRDGKAWFIAFLRMFIAPLYTLAVLCLTLRRYAGRIIIGGTLLAILLPAQRWFGGVSLGSVINPIVYQSEYFGIGLLISWALWAVLILYVVLALRHTRWQRYTPLALGWTVVLGLHGWLAPLWQVLGGAEAASWYYPVVSGLINLLAAAVVLLTVRAIYRARREKKSA